MMIFRSLVFFVLIHCVLFPDFGMCARVYSYFANDRRQASKKAHRKTLADILVDSILVLCRINSAYSFCQAKHTQAGEEHKTKKILVHNKRIATNLDVDKVVGNEDG